MMLLLISSSNIPFAAANDTITVKIENKSDQKLYLLRHKNKSIFGASLPSLYYCHNCNDTQITIYPSQTETICIADTCEIYDLYAADYLSHYKLGTTQRSECQMTFDRITQEGQPSIKAKLSRVFRKGKSACHPSYHDGLITITAELVLEFLGKENPPKQSQYETALTAVLNSTFFEERITKDMISNYMDSKYIPPKPYSIESDSRFFLHLAERIDTFTVDNLPVHLQLKKERMLSEGMFFTGTRDSIGCYVCNNRIHNWQENDDPQEEHALYSPECTFSEEPKAHVHYPLVNLKNIADATINLNQIKERIDEVAGEEKTVELLRALHSLLVLVHLTPLAENSAKDSNIILINDFAKVYKYFLFVSKIKLNDKVFGFDESIESTRRTYYHNIRYFNSRIDAAIQESGYAQNSEARRLKEQKRSCKFLRQSAIDKKDALKRKKLELPQINIEITDVFQLEGNEEPAIKQAQNELKKAIIFYRDKVPTTDISQLKDDYLTELLRFFVIGKIISSYDFIDENIKNAFKIQYPHCHHHSHSMEEFDHSLCADFEILENLFSHEETGLTHQLFPFLADRIREASCPILDKTKCDFLEVDEDEDEDEDECDL